MEKVASIRSIAAPMPMENVDTDMIIPAQFLKTISRRGLGKFAFHNIRYDAAGRELADFVFNKDGFAGAEILIARENFGCGSSREHAVWALMELGVRCVLAPSFGEIFALNAVHNGLVLVELPGATIETLLEKAARGSNAVFSIDIEQQQIVDPDGDVVPFALDARRRTYLLQGGTDGTFIAQRFDAIRDFEARAAAAQPWAAKYLRL